jgi:hypothetical protein
MRDFQAFADFAGGQLLQTYLPDFVLAFAFFCSLAYGVLAKRLDRQRPAIAVSAALGFALSLGLVYWEQQQDLSVRDLGPFAVGFAVLVLGAVMYQAIRQVGGGVAGIGIALGGALLISGILGVQWWLDPETIRTTITIALVVGVLAFLMHTRWHGPAVGRHPAYPPPVRREARAQQRAERGGGVTSDLLGRRLGAIRRQATLLDGRPELADNVAAQIRRILPAEGWLTQRLAELRKKAHRVRNGHVARLNETRETFSELPTSAKKRASAALAAGYQEMAGLDTRMERLNGAAAVCEKRIRLITTSAEQAARGNDHRRLTDLLKEAQELQKHNSKIFTAIDRVERKLTALAKKVAREAKEAGDA